MLDAQRMYNYAASSAVEFMGLQTKTPWIAPVEAVEELETYWNEANRINTSVLPYKSLREDGSVIPPPSEYSRLLQRRYMLHKCKAVSKTSSWSQANMLQVCRVAYLERRSR